MSDKRRDGKPYIWPTWITGLISGDAACQWAAWFKTHFYYDKRPDAGENTLAVWKSNHAEVVRQRADYLRSQGWTVTVESQNKFTYKGEAALVGGCPDIVARQGVRCRIEDVKTGKERDSDFYQVAVYMMLVARLPEHRGHVFEGAVVYTTRVREITEAEAKAASKQIVVQVLRTSSDAEPGRTPSEPECARCNIASCTDRVSGTDKVADEEAGGGLF